MDVCCNDLRVRGSANHPPSSECSEPHRSFFSRHGKKLIAAAAFTVSLAIAVSVAIVATLSNTSLNATAFANGDTSNNSNSSDGVASRTNNVDPNENSNITINSITPFSGNISDFIVVVRNQEVFVRQSTSSANDCSAGKGLWNLLLVTDDYPWEIKWELYGSSSTSSSGESSLASGPPEGKNYSPRTRYTGNICLPAGLYYMRWFDITGDGLCCKYGRGGWTVSVNGEVVLENDSTDNVEQKDFPFQVASNGGEMTGTFLIMPRPINPVMNVEFVDGTIYELWNLPPDFDYADSGLVSGVSSIVLPDTEIFSNGTADMKGKAPLVINRRLLDKHHKEVNKETSSRLSRRKQEQVGNLRASCLHRKLANFKGDKTVLAVRVIAADGTTTADETLLSNSVFGNGVDPANLVSQFKACSYGKMNIIKAQSKSGWSKSSGDVQINNGIVTVHLPSIMTTQGDALMRNAITDELNKIFGVETPSQLANYVMYCLPPGTYTGALPGEGIAYAYINSWLSVFNDDWCTSVSLQMHEIGHTINFGHSNEGELAYEDQTGIMGYSYPNNNAPLTCFNAAKSWQTGWYRDKGITINSSGKTTCFSGILHGVADYPIANTVLLKIQNGSDNDYYLNFNAKKGINSGAQEAGNQITVVSRPRGPMDSYAESDLVAKLGREEYYSILGYTIFVGVVDTNAGTAAVTVLPTGQDYCDSK